MNVDRRAVGVVQLAGLGQLIDTDHRDQAAEELGDLLRMGEF
ncbi:hypothetical protein [Fodinicola acaciae]|nr:hypothetical protein [Fodinicola acaciae]